MLDGDIRLFVEIVEAGSLAGAARSLKISAPMVSKRLTRLEQRLGAALIHRTTRRLVLTDAGERFYADLSGLSVLAAEAEARLRGVVQIPQGRLRITAPTSFGRMHIAPALPRFIAAFPKVDVELYLSDAYVDLVEDRFDLSLRIAADTGMAQMFEVERLAHNRRCLCASPDYLKIHGAPANVADLKQHDLLAADGQLPWRLERSGRRWVLEGRSRVATNSSEVVRELALAGAGIALRSLWDVGQEIIDGRLVPVLPDIGGSRESAILIVRPKAKIVSPAVLAFSAFLREVIGEAGLSQL